jgi:hypothetical protein
MRLDGHEEKGCSGEKWASAMEAQEEHEAEQEEGRTLATADAGEHGGEDEYNGAIPRGRIQEKNEDASRGGDSPPEEGKAETQQPEWRDEKQSPRRIGHNQRVRSDEILRSFESEYAGRRIGVLVMDEQLRRAPVFDEIHERGMSGRHEDEESSEGNSGCEDDVAQLLP